MPIAANVPQTYDVTYQRVAAPQVDKPIIKVMTRFMKPRFFDPSQQDAVAAVLDLLNIGDPEGRRIFILAMEYELAEYEKYLTKSPVRDEAGGDNKLRDISLAASGLSSLLKDLPDMMISGLCEQLAEFDTYSRSYNEAYLSAMSVELDRVALASWHPDQQRSTAQGQLGEAGAHFVEMFAEAYAECFETPPLPDAAGPFALLLNQVVQIAGLDMSVRETDLRRILEQ